MNRERVQELWQESVTDDLIETIYNFADEVEKAAQIAALRGAADEVTSGDSAKELRAMADKREAK